MADRNFLEQLLGINEGIDATRVVDPQGEMSLDRNPLIQPELPPPGTVVPSGVSPVLPEGLPTDAPVVAPELPPAPLVTTTQSTDNTQNTSTSTTSQERSQATIDAEAESDAAADAKIQALEQQAAADAKLIQEEDKLKEADNRVIAEVEQAKADARQESIFELQDTIAKKDALAAELTNYKPETFWGSKETSDKISSAIAVGLGSFAQSLTGSGQNVGMVLLQRQMDEFDRNQKQKYDAKVKQIENMNLTIGQKRQMLQEADLVFDAQKTASRAQIQATLGRGMTMAKTASVKAALGQKVAQVQQDKAKIDMEQASKYEQRITSNESNNLVKRMQTSTQSGGPTGTGKALTEGQAKARLAYADVAATKASLKGLDVNKVTLSPEYQAYMKEKRADSKLDAAPFGLGFIIQGPRNALVGSPDEVVAKKNPELIAMDRAIDAWTRGIIRFKSGAAIAVKEFGEERDQYWPTLGDTPESAKVKERNRLELEKAMRQAGAL